MRPLHILLLTVASVVLSVVPASAAPSASVVKTCTNHGGSIKSSPTFKRGKERLGFDVCVGASSSTPIFRRVDPKRTKIVERPYVIFYCGAVNSKDLVGVSQGQHGAKVIIAAYFNEADGTFSLAPKSVKSCL